MGDNERPRAGDKVIYRETCVRPGLEVDDDLHPAIVYLDCVDGRPGVWLRTFDAAMHGAVPRWQPPAAAAGDGAYGWCWPEEAERGPLAPA